MKLHYSQTLPDVGVFRRWFCYLMKLHYSQTVKQIIAFTLMFCYLMKLHYSQTPIRIFGLYIVFCYLMKLHYSQTLCDSFIKPVQFCYLMKLHYSQTSNKLRHYQHRVISYQLYDIKKSHFCQSHINPYLLSLYLPWSYNQIQNFLLPKYLYDLI